MRLAAFLLKVLHIPCIHRHLFLTHDEWTMLLKTLLFSLVCKFRRWLGGWGVQILHIPNKGLAFDPHLRGEPLSPWNSLPKPRASLYTWDLKPCHTVYASNDFWWTLAIVCLGGLLAMLYWLWLQEGFQSFEKAKVSHVVSPCWHKETLTDPSSPPGTKAQVSFSGWHAHELSHHCWQNYTESIQLHWEHNGCTWFLLKSALSTF